MGRGSHGRLVKRVKCGPFGRSVGLPLSWWLQECWNFPCFCFFNFFFSCCCYISKQSPLSVCAFLFFPLDLESCPASLLSPTLPFFNSSCCVCLCPIEAAGGFEGGTGQADERGTGVPSAGSKRKSPHMEVVNVEDTRKSTGREGTYFSPQTPT